MRARQFEGGFSAEPPLRCKNPTGEFDMATGAETMKNTAEQTTVAGAEAFKATAERAATAGNQAFQDGVQKSLGALNEINAQGKRNLEAVVASVTAAARGAEALGAQAMAYT